MNQKVQPLGKETETRPAQGAETPAKPPKPRQEKPEDIDKAVEGRDRLKGNEQTPMAPGVPDSGNA